MKIGGLTWWRYNYGSILQAYALQSKLNEFPDVDYEIICQYGKKVASVSNLKDKLKRIGVMATAKRVIWKFGLRKLRSRNARIQKFMDENLKVSEKEYSMDTMEQANEVYDGFVCGSDQVWNPELVATDSIYWLGFAKPGKLKFSYAPSVGVNSLTDEQTKAIVNNLKDFKAISTREAGGTELINKALGEDRCVTVLDPTLMVDRKLWDKLSASPLYNQKYIFVYMLRGTKKQRKLIEEFARNKNLPIVTMPFLDSEKIELYDFSYGDIKLWDADPSDFIKAIRYAEYVFTDSFHSMVFSSLYHTDFFTFPKIGKAQLNRVTGLQDMLKIKGRMITENTEIDDIEKIEKINWDTVDEILNEKRAESRSYIENVLKK